jgi:hypothetical protein
VRHEFRKSEKPNTGGNSLGCRPGRTAGAATCCSSSARATASSPVAVGDTAANAVAYGNDYGGFGRIADRGGYTRRYPCGSKPMACCKAAACSATGPPRRAPPSQSGRRSHTSGSCAFSLKSATRPRRRAFRKRSQPSRPSRRAERARAGEKGEGRARGGRLATSIFSGASARTTSRTTRAGGGARARTTSGTPGHQREYCDRDGFPEVADFGRDRESVVRHLGNSAIESQPQTMGVAVRKRGAQAVAAGDVEQGGRVGGGAVGCVSRRPQTFSASHYRRRQPASPTIWRLIAPIDFGGARTWLTKKPPA